MFFDKLGLEVEFKGKDIDEAGIVKLCTNENNIILSQWKEIAEIDLKEKVLLQ